MLSIDLAARGGTVNFLLLNPSTADEFRDDPTIRRCTGYAADWGFGRLLVTNLFALRSTDPRALTRAGDPVGPANDHHITEAATGAHTVVAAWGNAGAVRGRADAVALRLAQARVGLHALKITRLGSPAHPLYLPRGIRPSPWLPAGN
jgi:hypothetical protein